MSGHGEEEDKVDDGMHLADNPHAYLFGGDPIVPAAPEPYEMQVETHQPPPLEKIPSPKPESPKQIVAPPVSPPKSTTTPTKRTVRAGEFDDRFKTTVEYQSIMTTLVKLKEQRDQAISDLKRLETERKKAQDDPQTWANTIVSKREFLPRRQVPPNVPAIDFTFYDKLAQKPGGVVKVEPTKSVKRVAAAPKSVPHHTPWTLEEQHRLEQLLVEYPDEPVAAYRWEKIARALGRTPKQVVSRIHRYFERLARAGLPVPGRLPTSTRQPPTGETDRNTTTSTSKPSHTAHRTYNVLEAPAVKMDTAVPVLEDAALLTDGEKRMFAGMEDSDDYKELVRLKRLKLLQERSGEVIVSTAAAAARPSSSGLVHHGSQCASCLANPIVGTLYSCIECTSPRTTLCGNCHAQGSYTSKTHSLAHHFDVEQSVHFVDTDYALSDELAYLDPNYGT